MIGKPLASRFVIEETLGKGGMAVVYKAFDRHLDRHVALKMLLPEVESGAMSTVGVDARELLRREARTASKLDHENICTIFDIGDTEEGGTYIAMAYYDGVTLSRRIRNGGALPVNEALALAAQVARGLAYAHARDVIHRDIKPSNILVTPEGRVKILDFGIARLSDELRQRETRVLGTVPYMSPEQLRGDPLDARTDVWSLGVVLYEAVGGGRPFSGDDRDALCDAIQHRNFEPLAELANPQSRRVEQILRWCLAKRPTDRYRDADELRAELEAPSGSVLRGPTPGTASSEVQVRSTAINRVGPLPETETSPSIAVLPFVDQSPGKTNVHLSHGLAEELTSRLARLDGLRVIGRTSAFHPSLAELDAPEICRRLGVGTLLEGSLTHGSTLRVRVQLLAGDDGEVLWADRFDRELEDLLAIQDEIAEHIAAALEVELLGRAPADRISHEAHHLYLKGRRCLNRRTVGGLVEAIDYFEKAKLEEPGFAQAYAGLADARALLGIYGACEPEDTMMRAAAAAERAIELDGSLAAAHTSRGCVQSAYHWKFLSAAGDFQKAIQRDPQYATAYQWYAMNVLLPRRRFNKARDLLTRARELEPLSLPIRVSQSLARYYSGDASGALQGYAETEADFPGQPLLLTFQAHARRETGDLDGAEKSARAAFDRGSVGARAALATVFAARGDRNSALDELDRLMDLATGSYVAPTLLAQVYSAAGELDLACNALDRARRLRAADLIWVGVDPVFRPLHPLMRFRDLLDELGLVAPPTS